MTPKTPDSVLSDEDKMDVPSSPEAESTNLVCNKCSRAVVDPDAIPTPQMSEPFWLQIMGGGTKVEIWPPRYTRHCENEISTRQVATTIPVH